MVKEINLLLVATLLLFSRLGLAYDQDNAHPGLAEISSERYKNDKQYVEIYDFRGNRVNGRDRDSKTRQAEVLFA